MNWYSVKRRPLDRTTVVTLAAVVVPFVVLRVALGSILPVGLLSGLLVAASMVLGPAVAVGGALGVVGGDLATGALGVWTVQDAIAVSALPLGLCLLWGHAGLVEGGTESRMSSLRQVAEYAVATAVSAALALALLAWVTPALGLQPFFIDHVGFLAGAALAAAVGALSLWALGRVGATSMAVVSPEPAERIGRTRVAAAFVLGTGWYLAGTGIAALTHDVRLFGSAIAVRNYAEGFVGSGPVGSALGRVLVVLWSVGDAIVVALGVVAAATLGYVLIAGRGHFDG